MWDRTSCEDNIRVMLTRDDQPYRNHIVVDTPGEIKGELCSLLQMSGS